MDGDYVEQVKHDDPEQFIAIGYLGNAPLSVIYEIRYDDTGEYRALCKRIKYGTVVRRRAASQLCLTKLHTAIFGQFRIGKVLDKNLRSMRSISIEELE